MSSQCTFRIRSAAALPEQRLHLVFDDSLSATVDLSLWIAKHRLLAPLRNPDLFTRAQVETHGRYVFWIEDELDLAADNLRNLATEQAGGIGHERIWNWMDRNSLTQQRAADAIGISRRMLNYYLSGAKPIPKTVWLACVGFEAEAAAQKNPKAA